MKERTLVNSTEANLMGYIYEMYATEYEDEFLIESVQIDDQGKTRTLTQYDLSKDMVRTLAALLDQ